MNEADRKRVREIFMQVMELSQARRDMALQQACAGDATIRHEVDLLIHGHQQAEGGRFMTAPTASAAVYDTALPSEHSGSTIANYKLLQLIGEGGFGSVFLAEQREPVQRKVALKIIKLGMDTASVVARFEQERQALALMDHPHIARVIDAGATDSGRPYFVMEYVKGDQIIKFADAHKLNLSDRLNLFTQVCQAVQHAHTKGVIHRDIKPSNILVSMTDGRPFAKVIDFGIAKATGARLTDKTLFTEHRQLIGTPEYMSPEQAEGSPDIDTRTDVYGLGVLLYELLTGLTPFDGKRLRSAAFAEMQRIIKEEEPPAPSMRLTRDLATLAATAAARRIEPAKLGTLLKGELDWIVMKALDKDRARRYETANALAADVARHLSGEPVEAAPPSAAYRMRKFVRKHRTGVLTTVGMAVMLLVGAIGTTIGISRAAQEREEKRIARNRLDNLAEHARLGLNQVLDESAGKATGGMVWALGSRSGESEHQVLQIIVDAALGAIRESKQHAAELETANAKLQGESDRAMDILKRIAAISIAQETPDPNARWDGETPPLEDGSRLWVFRPVWNEPDNIVIVDPAAHSALTMDEFFQRFPEPKQEPIPTDKAVLHIGRLIEFEHYRMEREVKRAELAEADIKYEKAALKLGEGFGDENAAARNQACTILEEVVQTREKWYGPDHLETVRALWGLAEAQEKGVTNPLFEEAATRLERSDQHPDGHLLWKYSQHAWYVLDLEMDIRASSLWLTRVASAIRTVYEKEGPTGLSLAAGWLQPFGLFEPFRGLGTVTADDVALWEKSLESLRGSQLVELIATHWTVDDWPDEASWTERAHREWDRIRDSAQDVLAESPDDPHALTALAAVLRVLGQPAEALDVVHRAVESRIRAGLPPSPINQAIIAMSLHAIGRADEAGVELTRLREMMNDKAIESTPNATRFSANAEQLIDHKPTSEQQLAEETRQRRLLQADSIMQRQLQPSEDWGFISPSIEELQKAYDSRNEYLGPNAVGTIEAQFAIACRKISEDFPDALPFLRDAIARAETSGELSRGRFIHMLATSSVWHLAALDFEYADAANLKIADALTALANQGEIAWAELSQNLSASLSGWQRVIRTAEGITALAQEFRERRGDALRAKVASEFRENVMYNVKSIFTTPEGRRWAKRNATNALTTNPECGECAVALSVAHYHLAEYDDALVAAAKSSDLFSKEGKGRHPVGLAVTAMARWQLDQRDEARAALAQLRELMKDPAWAGNDDAKALAAEAEALIEGKPAVTPLASP